MSESLNPPPWTITSLTPRPPMLFQVLLSPFSRKAAMEVPLCLRSSCRQAITSVGCLKGFDFKGVVLSYADLPYLVRKRSSIIPFCHSFQFHRDTYWRALETAALNFIRKHSLCPTSLKIQRRKYRMTVHKNAPITVQFSHACKMYSGELT